MQWHGHDWKMRERWELLFDSLFLTLKNRNRTNKLKYFKFWRDHFCGHHVFNTLQNDLHFYIWLFATGSVMLPLVYIGSVNVVGHAVLGWWCQWDRRDGSRRRSQSTRVKPSKHCFKTLHRQAMGPLPFPLDFSLKSRKILRFITKKESEDPWIK